MKKNKIIALILALITAGIIITTATFAVLNIVDQKDKDYINSLNNTISENNFNTETVSNVINQLNGQNMDVINYNLKKSNQEIVFNMESKQFNIINQFGGIIYPSRLEYKEPSSLWKFVDDEKDISKKYSSYLTKNFVESGDNTLNIRSGLDVGLNSDIKTINFKEKDNKEIMIVTNGSNLNISANKTYIKHFGYADSINFNKDSNVQFSEFGKTSFIDLYQGSISFKMASRVDKIYLNSSDIKSVLFFENGASVNQIGCEKEMAIESNISINPIVIDKVAFKKG